MSDLMHQGTLVVTKPPHYPTMHTREDVTHMAAFGLDEKQIAVILHCTPEEVRQHYAEELEHGLARINARVMSALLHQALYKDDVAAMKLWLVNKAGWRSGDGNKTQIANLLPNGHPATTPDGDLTIVQRREVITSILTRATRFKREQERVIDGTAKPVKPNGSNGNGSNGSGNGRARPTKVL